MSRFEPSTVKHENRLLRAMKAKCASCTFEDRVHMNSMRIGSGTDSEIEEREAVKKFEKLGWSFDKKNKCPSCIKEDERNRTAEPVKPELKVVATAPSTTPREMSREEKRIVFEKLNEVYVDEKVGYAPPWTDAKVASELGCPRAWVERVRSEMFGDVNSNADISALQGEARAVAESLNAATAAYNELGNEFKKLFARASEVEKRLREIEKIVR